MSIHCQRIVKIITPRLGLFFRISMPFMFLILQNKYEYFLRLLDNGAFHFCTFFYFNFVIQPKIDFSTNIYYIKDEYIIFYYQHTEYSTLKNRFLQYLEDRGSRIHDVKNHVLIIIIYLFIWLTLAFIVTYFTLLNLQIFSMIDIWNIRFQHPIFKKSRKVLVRFIIYEIKLSLGCEFLWPIYGKQYVWKKISALMLQLDSIYLKISNIQSLRFKINL